MKSFHFGKLVLGSTLVTGLWLGPASHATAAPATIPFWEKPAVQPATEKYTPAFVQLLAGPDLSAGLATFDAANPAGQTDFVPTNPRVVPYVQGTDQAYRVIPQGLKEGANPYTDRKYKFTSVPARFRDLTLLQTKGGHKGIVDGRFAIQLMVAQPAILFLAIDRRDLKTYEAFGCPPWLQDFEPTGEQLLTDDPMLATAGSAYLVFRKKIPAGPLTLGPCAVDPRTDSMYFAFFGQLDPTGG